MHLLGMNAQHTHTHTFKWKHLSQLEDAGGTDEGTDSELVSMQVVSTVIL